MLCGHRATVALHGLLSVARSALVRFVACHPFWKTSAELAALKRRATRPPPRLDRTAAPQAAIQQNACQSLSEAFTTMLPMLASSGHTIPGHIIWQAWPKHLDCWRRSGLKQGKLSAVRGARAAVQDSPPGAHCSVRSPEMPSTRAAE